MENRTAFMRASAAIGSLLLLLLSAQSGFAASRQLSGIKIMGGMVLAIEAPAGSDKVTITGTSTLDSGQGPVTLNVATLKGPGKLYGIRIETPSYGAYVDQGLTATLVIDGVEMFDLPITRDTTSPKPDVFEIRAMDSMSNSLVIAFRKRLPLHLRAEARPAHRKTEGCGAAGNRGVQAQVTCNQLTKAEAALRS